MNNKIKLNANIFSVFANCELDCDDYYAIPNKIENEMIALRLPVTGVYPTSVDGIEISFEYEDPYEIPAIVRRFKRFIKRWNNE